MRTFINLADGIKKKRIRSVEYLYCQGASLPLYSKNNIVNCHKEIGCDEIYCNKKYEFCLCKQCFEFYGQNINDYEHYYGLINYNYDRSILNVIRNIKISVTTLIDDNIKTEEFVEKTLSFSKMKDPVVSFYVGYGYFNAAIVQLVNDKIITDSIVFDKLIHHTLKIKLTKRNDGNYIDVAIMRDRFEEFMKHMNGPV